MPATLLHFIPKHYQRVAIHENDIKHAYVSLSHLSSYTLRIKGYYESAVGVLV